MKRTLALALSMSLFGLPALADDAHHPDKAATAAGSDATVKKPVANAPAKNAQPVEKIELQVQKTQALMDKINTTADPAQRQKLMHEHTQAMMEGMQMMHGMGGDMMAGMMGKGDSGSSKSRAKRGPASGAMMCDHAMMEKHLAMMQTMMEQMMAHQQATESATK